MQVLRLTEHTLRLPGDLETEPCRNPGVQFTRHPALQRSQQRPRPEPPAPEGGTRAAPPHLSSQAEPAPTCEQNTTSLANKTLRLALP